MSISIKINSGEDQPFAVDIDRLPAEISVERPDVSFAFVPFGLFALVAVFIALQGISIGIAFSAVLALGAVMTFVLMRVLARQGRRHTMLFERKRVVVTEAGLLKDKIWQADYSEFEGVYMRRRIAKSGLSNSTYQIIELKHHDSAKTLPLYVDLHHKAPTKRWNSYVELFNLPGVKEGY